MRSRTFRLPRTLLGFAAAFALGLSVLGSSAHNHALDDGLESEVRVCVVAGIAVLPSPQVDGACGTAAPPVSLRSVPTTQLVARIHEHGPDRARAPPVGEFGIG